MSHRRNQVFINVLEREIYLKRKGDSRKKGISVDEMSGILGVDPTALSHYRSGKRTLSAGKAMQFARALRRGGTQEEIVELAEELRTVSGGQSHSKASVEDWFTHLVPGSLLLVEFREPPAIRPFGPRSHLIEKIAEAVAHGMSYGMMVPTNPEGLESLPLPLRSYLREVYEAVVSTYWMLLRKVAERVCEESDGDRERIRQATGRLKLYRLRETSDLHCPAIGCRVFYLEPSTGPHDSQCWQWISSGHDDYMLPKDSSSRELEAIACRYFPIAELWRASSPRALPEDDEMTRYVHQQSSYREQLHLPEQLLWKAHEIRKLADLIEEVVRSRAAPSGA